MRLTPHWPWLVFWIAVLLGMWTLDRHCSAAKGQLPMWCGWKAQQ